ncbi:hypothetical protein DFQ28_009374, partial [Apophysomyces sp. BC1034]
MPYVNIVGIGNVGTDKLKSFAVAGAWTSDETKNSYELVMIQLNTTVINLSILPPG